MADRGKCYVSSSVASGRDIGLSGREVWKDDFLLEMKFPGNDFLNSFVSGFPWDQNTIERCLAISLFVQSVFKAFVLYHRGTCFDSTERNFSDRG